MVKWCLRGFEVSDKYREQRHFSRLVHDNTVIGNISEIVVTVGYSSLLIKKFGNYIISLLYLIPFMIILTYFTSKKTTLKYITIYWHIRASDSLHSIHKCVSAHRLIIARRLTSYTPTQVL